MPPKYKIQILDRNLVPVAEIKSFVPINQAGDFLQYRDVLSDVGICKFRVGTEDPAVLDKGNIFTPYKYHVRIYRADSLVWNGVIINNPRRTKRYIEVEAKTYLFLLSKVLVRRDASVSAGDGKDNYRTFQTGTMATAVQNLITEAKSDAGSDSILSRVTIGQIENPSFPANYTQSDGSALSGTWTFSSNMTLQYDYRDVLFVIGSLAMYPACDFEITKDLVFNFKQYIGSKQPNIVFEYSNWGSISDYDSPLNGERMANDLTGVAADYGNQILHTQKSDEASVAEYGRIQDVAAYIDVKNINALRSRLTEELRLISKPDAELHITLNDRAYPLGQYALGDLVRVKIKDSLVEVDQLRRVVGVEVKVDINGTESIRLITNKPKEGI
jgi:hypothetical protein